MIKISIDVTLIDKSKIKEITRKNGNVAKFFDLVLIESPNSEYGDYIVRQDCTKEEREAKKQMPILGNGKIMGQRPPAPKAASPETDDDSSVPF